MKSDILNYMLGTAQEARNFTQLDLAFKKPGGAAYKIFKTVRFSPRATAATP